MTFDQSQADAPGSRISRGVFLPSFCGWKALLGVSVVSQLAVILVLLGQSGPPRFDRVAGLSAYALGLGLACAVGLCVSRAWIRRLSTRDAWLAAWLAVFVTTIAFSFSVAVVSGALGFGPGPGDLSAFMLKSVLGASVVAAALFRYLYIRMQWQVETLAEAEARVQALQSRIRPHFLFNSLNTIASLIADEPDSAERATLDLADLFRGGMRRADQLIPLSEELALARKYLQMEQRRLGERLAVSWKTEDLPADIPVLPMILQPLLENAVGHGIQPRPDGGEVRLYGRLAGNSVVITISNPLAESEPQSGHGLALRNIRDRLQLSYGAAGSLVTNKDDERFYAVLTLPHAETADH